MIDLEDPAAFLYLNPVLQATNQAITVEDAVLLYNRDPSKRLLPSKIPNLQDDFDPLVYLSTNRDSIDVSETNRLIFDAMSNVGRDVATIYKNSSFHGTILKKATLTDLNSFVFEDQTYNLSSKILQVGDEIKISTINNNYHMQGRVSVIRDDNRGFTIQTLSNFACLEFGSGSKSDYVVFGIRLYDMERLAKASIATKLLTNPDFHITSIDTEFDIDLYHLLYPDSRLMCQSEAYVDYINNWGSENYRITKASDLQNVRAPGIRYKDLDVSNTLTVGGTSLIVRGADCVCDPAQRADATAILQGTYVGNALNIGGSNLIVNGSSVIVTGLFSVGSNALNVSSNALSVRIESSYSCNVSMARSLGVACDVRANKLIACSAIGIGSSGVVVSVRPTCDNVDLASPHADENETSLQHSNVQEQGVQSQALKQGVGKWAFEEASNGALTLKHPLLTPNMHVFDTSGRIGINLDSENINPSLKNGMVLNGDLFTTGSVISQSDRRVKKDLVKIEGALQRLSLLTGYVYTSRNGDKQRCTGLLAQDVQSVLPEAVHEDDEGLLSIAYGNLAGLFVEAIKELKRDVRELRACLDARMFE